MNKYVIFQTDKVTPLATVEAKSFELIVNFDRLKFTDDNGYTIAIFNWNNISGFKKLEDNKNE
jgi:hypothetical protein